MIQFKINFFLLSVTIVLLKSICIVKCCKTFDSVFIQVIPLSSPPYNDTIVGCIDPSTIANKGPMRARKIFVQNEDIPILKHGTVQNLARVEDIKFFQCSIKQIEVGAFRQLPALRSIDLESNKVRTINKVFEGFPWLNKIILDHNKISFIEDGAFSNLERLTEVYLRFNRISAWNANWFLNVNNMSSVYFDYNAIDRIPVGAFITLLSIDKIYLSYNNISEIEEDAFDGIEKLDLLDVSYNFIKSVNEFCFRDQIAIKTLLLNANRLNFLPSKALDKLHVDHFGYDGNPWLCSCYNELTSWVINENVTVKSSFYCSSDLVPVCTNPEMLDEKCIETYDNDSTQLYFNSVKGTNNNFLKRCVRVD